MNDAEYDELVSIIADHFGLYGYLLVADTDITEDLGADAIDKQELVLTVEEYFDVRLSPEEIARIGSVASIAAAVDGHNGRKRH